MNIRKRTFLSFLLLLALLVVPLASVTAQPAFPKGSPPAKGLQGKANPAHAPGYLKKITSSLLAASPRTVYPEVIPLPNGFQPEGIVIGKGHTFYAGSLANGAIYQGDLRTGQGSLLFGGETGRVSVGLAYDQRSGYLFVAGGPTGYAYVYDTRDGSQVASYQLSTDPSFINDVVVTRQAAYFTNSFQAVMYRLPLGPRGSLLDAPQAITLGGDWEQAPNAFNANGIEATPNGDYIIIVNSVIGSLYLVNPATGVADEIDLQGGDVTNGDGILLSGKTLYVVQNQFNQVAVVQLSNDWSSGEITRVITDPNFRIPTTAGIFGNALYIVNARFDTPPTPDTKYEVVRVPVK